MGRIARLGHALLGIIMLLCALLLAAIPKEGATLVAAILSSMLVVYGIQKIIYYFTMARHMVGGYSLLFVGIIAIDLGAFSLTLLDQPHIPIVIYLISYFGIMGVSGILRAIEGRRFGLKWGTSLAHGIVSLLLVIACVVSIGNDDIIMTVFSIGMAYSAIRHIATSLRRTDVIFIQ